MTAISSEVRALPNSPIWRMPIVIWGGLGAASMALIVFVLVRWAWAGVHTVAPGPDPFDGTTLVVLRILEWGQFLALLGLFAWFVAKPLMARQDIGFDGLLVLAAFSLNFWDPLDNYLVFAFQYNAHFLNIGSWGGFIPGWRSPGGDTWAVPILFVFGAYTWAFFSVAPLGCAIIRRLDRAAPHWSIMLKFAVVFGINAALEAICELIFLRSGAMANIRTLHTVTIWSGFPYQWPLYNPILFGLAWTAIVWLRWSRNERGLSAVERGADQIGLARPVVTSLRYLAIFAFLQVSYIGLYYVPWNLFASAEHGTMMPLPSYFPTPHESSPSGRG